MIWVLLLLGLYPFVLYPFLAYAVGRIVAAQLPDSDHLGSVTVLISAFNEAACIEQTIRNKLDQEYPRELLDIVVVSDGSTDGTDEIVARLAGTEPRVRLLRQEPRQGKTSALNMGMQSIDSEIVVFSDANSRYAPDAIRQLVRCFSDPSIGYVTGRMEYDSDRSTVAGEGISTYMSLENCLREWETQIGSIVGTDGGIDAVRRNLYREMPAHSLPDFVLPLSVVEQGYRVVYQPGARLRESSNDDSRSELKMRVRVTTRALWALLERIHLLNPARYGWFSWQLLSHKWLRYLSFIPLGTFAVVVFITHQASTMHFIAAAGTCIFIILGVTGLAFRTVASRFRLIRPIAYFLLLNLASAVAVFKVVSGQKFITWKPRAG